MLEIVPNTLHKLCYLIFKIVLWGKYCQITLHKLLYLIFEIVLWGKYCYISILKNEKKNKAHIGLELSYLWFFRGGVHQGHSKGHCAVTRNQGKHNTSVHGWTNIQGHIYMPTLSIGSIIYLKKWNRNMINALLKCTRRNYY